MSVEVNVQLKRCPTLSCLLLSIKHKDKVFFFCTCMWKDISVIQWCTVLPSTKGIGGRHNLHTVFWVVLCVSLQYLFRTILLQFNNLQTDHLHLANSLRYSFTKCSYADKSIKYSKYLDMSSKWPKLIKAKLLMDLH